MKTSFFVYLFFIWSLMIKASNVNYKFGNFVTVATWNIGHFSNGNKNYTIISETDYERKLIQFRQLIYEDLCPDVICLNEYSAIFGKNRNGHEQAAKDALFDGFRKCIIGDQRWYSCNALFGNCKLKRLKQNDFECCKSWLLNNPKADQYYYISADLYIGWKKLKLVCVHLYPWDSKIRSEQMQELIDIYRNSKRVLMCGDWNTEDYSLFKNAGYALVNDGSNATFPPKKMALDNIIVKGLNISNVRMIKTDLSDHYPLVCRISL